MMMQRPLLPRAEEIAKFLTRIDESRFYTNFGNLVREYEQKLSQKFNAEIVSTASCTSGLTATLLSYNFPRGSWIAVPSYTFVGTVSAILAAGHRPMFVDVSENWMFEPYSNPMYDDGLGLFRDGRIVDIEAFLMVSPFGQPIDLQECDKFTKRTKVPVIIDAAGGFHAFQKRFLPFETPVVISTHATKVFGTGEGGFVMTCNKEKAENIRKRTNFGISPNRSIEFVGLNAKMSEYHAAVGLAELEDWPDKKARWINMKKKYCEVFGRFSMVNPVLDVSWAGSLFPIRLNRPVGPVMEKMQEKGVPTRKIWGDGCHKQPAFKKIPHADLSMTERLTESVLCLPFSIDTTDEEIEFIKKALEESL